MAIRRAWLELPLVVVLGCVIPTARAIPAEEARASPARKPRLSREEAVAVLNGVVVPLITPVTKDLAFDAAAMKALVEHLIAEGVHGLFPCGITGQYKLFTTEERREIITTVLKAAAGRVPVFAGVDEETPELTIAQAKWAEAAGADGVMVIPPGQDQRGDQRQRSPDAVRGFDERLPRWQEEVADFYRRLHAEVETYIVVHDRGDRSLYVLPETYAKLADLDRVVGLKRSSSSPALFPAIREAVRGRLAVACGNEYVYLGALAMGGTGGVVGGGANIYPKLLLKIRERFLEGDLRGALEYQTRINQFAARLRGIKDASRQAIAALGVPVQPYSRGDGDDEFRAATRPATSRDIEEIQRLVRDLTATAKAAP